MARPIKEGLDYFPLDTFLDTKFELIEAEFGLQGFAIIVKLFQKIYGERGYYCEWTNEVALLFSRRSGGGKVVSEIVQAAIRRGIFNADMYDKYSILTSKGIQERYFDAVNRRTNVKALKEYLLIPATQISENVNINEINVNINSKNVDINTQSKVKKSKVNESKEGARARATLTPDEKNSLAEEFGRGVADAYFQHFEKYCRESGKSYSDPKGTVRSWILKDIASKSVRNFGKGTFNNYTDSGKPDYTNFSEQILKDMLGE